MFLSPTENVQDVLCALPPTLTLPSPLPKEISCASQFSLKNQMKEDITAEMGPSRLCNRAEHRLDTETPSQYFDNFNIHNLRRPKSSWPQTNTDFVHVRLRRHISNQGDVFQSPEFGTSNMDNFSSASSPSAVAILHDEHLGSVPMSRLNIRDQHPTEPASESPYESGFTTPGLFSLSSASSSNDLFQDDCQVNKDDDKRQQMHVNHDSRMNNYQSVPLSPQYLNSSTYVQNDSHDNETRHTGTVPQRPFRSLFPSPFASHIGPKEMEHIHGICSDAETSTPNLIPVPPEMNQYPSFKIYSTSLPSPRTLLQRRQSDERSNNQPDPSRSPIGYSSESRQERSQSFSGQSGYDFNPYSAAQPFYAPCQTDHRITAAYDGNVESRSQTYSQLVAEAQLHVRSKMMFTQQRMQDQHLQQQQFQQLHRLHTQQLKQAKQKIFDARLQPSELSKYDQQLPRKSFAGSIYQVQFKRDHRYMILDDSLTAGVELGSFVIVEADRGEDLGIVVFIAARDSSLALSLHAASNSVRAGSENTLKKILRLASLHEKADLPRKAKDEMDILSICREMAPEKYRLSISLEDAEYQFDRHKLILYYSAARRIDFREFVRDLYAVYKIRIWMQPVDVTNGFRPSEVASRALATGFLNGPTHPPRGWNTPVSVPENINCLSPMDTHISNGMNPAGILGVNQSFMNGGVHVENSLRSCPPSTSGTYSNLNIGYYGNRAQQPAPFFPLGR